MVAVAERVLSANVQVDGKIIGKIGKGLLVLIGVETNDSQTDIDYIVRKVSGLRIFSVDGKMDKNITDVKGQLLVVSQFTLLGDARRGLRPDFVRAANSQHAHLMFEKCICAFKSLGIATRTGRFGAHMIIESRGDGPVNILLDSRRKF